MNDFTKKEAYSFIIKQFKKYSENKTKEVYLYNIYNDVYLL